MPHGIEVLAWPPGRDVGERRSRVETSVRQTIEKEKNQIQGGRSDASQQDSSYV